MRSKVVCKTLGYANRNANKLQTKSKYNLLYYTLLGTLSFVCTISFSDVPLLGFEVAKKERNKKENEKEIMNIVEEQKCVNMALESAYAKGKKDATEKSYNWLDENAAKICADKFIRSEDMTNIVCNLSDDLDQAVIDAYIVGFKAGYRKAMEE